MSDANNFRINTPCSYCGNYHNYSAEMCKDLINNRSGFLNLTTYAPCDSCKRPTEAEVREGKRKAFVDGAKYTPLSGREELWIDQIKAEALRCYGGEV